MTFDRVPLPIPEELLAQSTLLSALPDVSSASKSPELLRLLDEYEYHSRQADEAIKQIRAIIDNGNECSNGISMASNTITTATICNGDSNVGGSCSTIRLASLTKAFSRKPRSLAKVDDNRFAGTALDGTLSIWSVVPGKQRLAQFNMSSMDKTVVPECMSSLDNGRLLVGVQEEGRLGRPTVLLFDMSDTNNDNNNNTDKVLPKRIANTGHVKAIKCVEWFDRDTFITGSDDHTIAIWYGDTRLVVNAHTSAVSAVKRLQAGVVSAGADGRLNRVDVKTGKLVETKKTSTRFSQLYTDPQGNPHTLITSSQAASDQFAVYDCRMSLRSAHCKFGWLEQANLSAYVKAAWRANTPHIICGTQSPSDAVSKIVMFDIRCPSGPVGSGRPTDSSERRWLECLFMGEDRFVANATDGSLSFGQIL